MRGRFRFGEFEFDAGSGELRRADPSKGDEVQRLAPQPARLLALLVHAGGQLVTRDRIREEVWPDVSVDFDAGLHYCIRQIRAALGESASASRYIETLPRRGYRMLVPVERLDATPVATRPARKLAGLVALVALLAVAGIVWLGAPVGGEDVVRIAIMPFEPPEDTTRFGDPGPIAEWVLEDLTPRAGDRAGIVGPTTTSAYDDSTPSLMRLASEYELDYIVNGRFMDAESGPRMLAELIRVSDGAHVWVRAYEKLEDDRRIGLEISRAVAGELGFVE